MTGFDDCQLIETNAKMGNSHSFPVKSQQGIMGRTWYSVQVGSRSDSMCSFQTLVSLGLRACPMRKRGAWGTFWSNAGISQSSARPLLEASSPDFAAAALGTLRGQSLLARHIARRKVTYHQRAREELQDAVGRACRKHQHQELNLLDPHRTGQWDNDCTDINRETLGKQRSF